MVLAFALKYGGPEAVGCCAAKKSAGPKRVLWQDARRAGGVVALRARGRMLRTRERIVLRLCRHQRQPYLRAPNNTLWCWGANESGQLGLGDHQGRRLPTQVAPGTLGSIAQVYAGEKHACAVNADGTLWCWGDNSYGQLGTGDQLPRLVPV